MRKQILATVVIGVLALGLAGSLAWAAGAVSANIPFSFIVNDKEMAAGRYEVRTFGEDETRLAIRSTEGSGQILVPVIERLADTGNKEPKVVFDKLEGKYRLSEVLFPGSDGYLVGIVGGKETHEVITAKP